MSALLLYLATTGVTVYFWSRFVQPVTRAAAIVAILLPLCFTGRALLTGRVYAPIDLPFVSEPLHAHRGDFGVGDPRNPMLIDLEQQIIPWRAAVREAWSRGEWPLLNQHMLCGDILASAAQPAPYDPVELLALLIPIAPSLTFCAAMTFFIAAFFAYALAKSLGCSDSASFVAAAAWMFSANMALFVGWPIGRAWAFLPLVLFAARRIAQEPVFRHAALLTIALTLEILAGHPETLLHVVAVAIAYGIAQRPSRRAIALACISGLVALALTAVFLLPFLDAMPQTAQHSFRSEFARQTYPVSYSDIRMRIRGWLMPWKQRAADSGGIGFLVLMPALASLVIARRRRDTFVFLALAVVCGGIGMNIPPFVHIAHSLPLFDVAINERMIFAADLCLAMLAALAIDALPALTQVLIVGLIVAERMMEVGSIYPSIPQRAFYPQVPAIAAIPRSAEPFRIAATQSLFVPDAAALYDLEDARGNSAMTNAPLVMTYPLWSVDQPVSFNRIDDATKPFLSFLNIRYLLTPLDSALSSPQWKLIVQDKGAKLFENTAVAPRAFVPAVISYRPNGVLTEMLAANEFTRRVWIETPEHSAQDVVNGSGRVIAHRAKLGLELDATMQRRGWIVISETAWRGWRVYVDDARVPYRIANHAFLGVYVPEGRHHVRLIFLPDAFTRGRAISFATLGLLAIGLVIRARRR